MILSKLIVAMYDVLTEFILWFLLIGALILGYALADTTTFMLSPDPDVHKLIFAGLCAAGMLVFEVLFVGFILNIMVMRRDIDEIKSLAHSFKRAQVRKEPSTDFD